MTADFDYKKYSLEHLENWLHDALDCEDLTPQDIYETITNAVDENIEHHKKYLTKNIEFLSLLKGHREIDFGDVMKEREYYEGWEGYDDFELILKNFIISSFEKADTVKIKSDRFAEI